MKKFKEHKTTIIITSIIILLPMVVGLLLWDRLPAEIATHFGSDGEANGWSSKVFTVFGLPLFLLFVHILCFAATAADPKKNRIGDKIYKLVLWICPVISWFSAFAIYGYEMQLGINVDMMGHLLVGVIFVVVGNYLPKCRQNYTIGIKLPWTLNDEENWNRTHRLAGFLWMIGGVVFMLLAFAPFGGMVSTLTVMGVMVLVPIIYSFVYYLRHK